MKKLFVFLFAATTVFLLQSCEKSNDPVSSNVLKDSTLVRFADTSHNVKIASSYINLEENTHINGIDTLDNSKWDIKLTRLDSVTSSFGQPYAMKLAAIVLSNKVQAKIVDGQTFENVSLNNVTGLKYDNPAAKYYVIGMNCFYSNENTRLYTPYTNRTFVLKTRNSKMVKIKILSFYKGNSSGYFTFDYLIVK